MTFLQNLWRDLVDKRLWPVAIVLVVAAVAVPFLIGGGSSSQDVADAGTAAPGPAAADGAVSVVAGPDGQKVDRSGKSRDPFKPLVYARTPKTAAAAGTTTATGATGTTTTTGKATTGGPTGSKQSVTPTTKSAPKANTKTTTPKTKATPKKTPTKSTTPKKSPKKSPATPSRTGASVYKLAVSIRQSGSTSTATRTGLRAGSYLPSRDNALLAFLGVRRDGRTASFHVASGVDVVGKDRRCSQGTATHCRTLEMRPGDSVRLDTTPPGGGFVTSYRFRVIRMTLVK